MNSINGSLEKITKEIKTVIEQLYSDHGKRDEVVNNALLHCSV